VHMRKAALIQNFLLTINAKTGSRSASSNFLPLMIRQTRDKMGEVTLFCTHISIFTMAFCRDLSQTAQQSFTGGPRELSQL